MVKNIEVVFGKGTVKGQKRKKTLTLTDTPFKKQSIFFKYLPYWKNLQTCHNIDLMHHWNIAGHAEEVKGWTEITYRPSTV
jgi:UTP:GlnB (protein PII) uridylyltransferase